MSPLLPWLGPVLWTFVILGLGSDSFAHSETSRFLGPLIRFLLPSWEDAAQAELLFWVRKLAHVVEYGVLAVLVVIAMLRSSEARALRAELLRSSRCWPALAIAMLWVLGVAGFDEYRQSLSDHRTGTSRDVALDAFGGGLALALLAALPVGLRAWLLGRPPSRAR